MTSSATKSWLKWIDYFSTLIHIATTKSTKIMVLKTRRLFYFENKISSMVICKLSSQTCLSNYTHRVLIDHYCFFRSFFGIFSILTFSILGIYEIFALGKYKMHIYTGKPLCYTEFHGILYFITYYLQWNYFEWFNT